MTIRILDTSVAVKWFFEDEPRRERAHRVLNDLVESPTRFAVPDLFFQELAAVLVRKSGQQGDFVTQSLESVFDLGIPTIATGRELMTKAIDFSCQHKVSYYDAVFLSTARMMKGVWLTADEKAGRRLPKDLVVIL